MYKLIIMKYPKHIIKLILSYLTDRQFQVKINQQRSETKNTTAGVPQGSVLGPKLFTYFINDIPTFEKTNIAIFADDTAVYAHSFSAEVANKQIQIHMNMITEFFDKWKISINNTKTEEIILTRKFTNNKIFSKLNVNGHKITPAVNVKYLGVNLDSRLNFKNHINKLNQNAYISLKNLYQLINKHSKMSEKTKKLLYTAVIRPRITYAAPVWCGVADTAILKLQRTQNRCLRLILGRDRYARIDDMHEQTKLETLRAHVDKLAETFYTTLIHSSTLTTHIADQRHRHDQNNKHKLLHQRLPLYHKELRTPAE